MHATNDKHIPTIEDMFGLSFAEDAQISPDGSTVAYTVIRPEFGVNEFIPHVWLADCSRVDSRQLSGGLLFAHLPRWSPDGRKLAVVAKRPGDASAQIYCLSLDAGEPEQLTQFESGVQSFAWSPDGEKIAFVATGPEDKASRERRSVFGELCVLGEDHKRSHLWLLQLASREVRPLTGGLQHHVLDLGWHPEGRRLAFESKQKPDENDWAGGRICIVDTQTSEVQVLTTRGDHTPRWSPDGSRIAFVRHGAHPADSWSLCVVPEAGGAEQVVPTTIDEQIELNVWAPEGIYVTAPKCCEHHLYRIDPATGAHTRITPEEPEGWSIRGHRCSYSATFDHGAMVAADADHFGDVTLLDLRTGAARKVTDLAPQVRGWAMTRPEVFRWRSADGTPIEGILLKPVDLDPHVKYPLLVMNHGGPRGATPQAILANPNYLFYPMVPWAAKGAFVLMPNFRGSTGYGEAFRKLNVGNFGVGDYWDTISGVDALIARGWVDPNRVGAMGYSHGGFVSAFFATYSDRFRAVSIGGGIADWTTFYSTSDIHHHTMNYVGARPWDDPEGYRRASPISYVSQARTPALIQHGEKDVRCPIANMFELRQALIDHGVETRMVTYKNATHTEWKPRELYHLCRDNWDWFNRWLWDEPPAGG